MTFVNTQRNIFIGMAIILTGSLLFLTGCQKQKLKKKYEGQYHFTTINYYWTLTNSRRDTIQYRGIIHVESKTTLKIEFSSNSIIYPTVDQDGILSYNAYLEEDSNNSFSGSFDEAGNVTFTMSYAMKGGGCSTSVKGIKY